MVCHNLIVILNKSGFTRLDSSIFICFTSYGLWNVLIVVVLRGWISFTLVNQTCGLCNMFIITLPSSCTNEGEYTRHQDVTQVEDKGPAIYKSTPSKDKGPINKTTPSRDKGHAIKTMPPHLMTRGQKLPKAPPSKDKLTSRGKTTPSKKKGPLATISTLFNEKGT
jgi:hypothetical protein